MIFNWLVELKNIQFKSIFLHIERFCTIITLYNQNDYILLKILTYIQTYISFAVSGTYSVMESAGIYRIRYFI
jgi:hypothetical protein